MAELGYKGNAKEKEESFPPIPAANYIAVIESSDIVPTKGKPEEGIAPGKALKLIYQIIDGPQKGKKLFNNINLENNGPKKAQVEKIARGTLNGIGLATIKSINIPDSSLLHNIPMEIEVSCNKEAQFPNSIKKHTVLEKVPANASMEPASFTEAVEHKAPPIAEEKKKQPWE